MYRLSNTLEEPKRGVARMRVRKLVDYKGMVTPTMGKPLVIASLAHSGFLNSAKMSVRSSLHEHVEACVPLFIPKLGVVV